MQGRLLRLEACTLIVTAVVAMDIRSTRSIEAIAVVTAEVARAAPLRAATRIKGLTRAGLIISPVPCAVALIRRFTCVADVSRD
jgi:hypothetical protein